jgi:hypothetical protein
MPRYPAFKYHHTGHGHGEDRETEGMGQESSRTCFMGRHRYMHGVPGVHLNTLGLFLCTSTPLIILSACLPS